MSKPDPPRPSASIVRNSEQPQTRDWSLASRDKGRDPLGTALFVLLRSADVYLQYRLLTSPFIPALLHSLNLRSISSLSTSASLPPPPSPVFLGLRVHGLTPYHATVLLLSLGSAAKQIYWQTAISREIMTPAFAVLIAAFNTLSNTLNTLLSICSATSQAPAVHGASPFAPSLLPPPSAPLPLPLPLASPSSSALSSHPSVASLLLLVPRRDDLFLAAYRVGLALYAAGMALELGSELQRRAFKADPRNRGRLHAEGLFAWATNVNYGGYLLWRAGYALACGGWAWAAAVAAGQGFDFASRAIPSMDGYCEARYGREEFRRARQKVKWRLLPFVY